MKRRREEEKEGGGEEEEGEEEEGEKKEDKKRRLEDLILRVARVHRITDNGYEQKGSPRRHVLTKIGPGFARELVETLRYIAWYVPYREKKTVDSWGSYGLKHDVERSIGEYVCNGSALLAFHLLDFKIRIKWGPNGDISCDARRFKRDHMVISDKKKISSAVQTLALHYIACATMCESGCQMPLPLIGIIATYLDFAVKVTAPAAFVSRAFRMANSIQNALF
jgi:hypothetical protein